MLTPVIAMKRTLIALFAVMSLAAVALASSLPQSGTVVVTNDSGAQVGTGTIAQGQLTLTLDAGTSGLVTLTVTASNGETETFQAMVDASSQVTVVHDGSFEKLDDFAKGSGIDKVEVKESTEASSSNDATCPESESSSAGSTGSTGPATTATSGGTGTTASCSDSSSNEKESESESSSSSSANTSGQESESSSDDSIKVGTSVGGTTGSTSTDTSVDVKASTDD